MLGLLQRDVARQLAVNVATIHCWERGTKHPMDRHLPAVIRFLGYDPLPEPIGLGEKLQAWRRRRGLSAKAAARRLGVDEGTLSRWERGIWKPKGARQKLVESLVAEL
jgi:DNA-binding transcriptional regulator YiaG